jgi:hypothetical protein
MPCYTSNSTIIKDLLNNTFIESKITYPSLLLTLLLFLHFISSNIPERIIKKATNLPIALGLAKNHLINSAEFLCQ